MQLHAVVVPPPGALDEVRAMLDGIFTPDPVDEPTRRHRRWRRTPDRAPAPEVGWQPNPLAASVVRVCKFGNVTLEDAHRLTAALRGAAPTWATPEVRVADVRLGETEPFTVAARLTGDLDALAELFGSVLGVAEGEGFFLDRRSFRSEVPLGTLTVPPGAVVPDSLPGTVIGIDGPAWTITHLRLHRVSHQGSDTVADEVAAIAMGSFAEGGAARAQLAG